LATDCRGLYFADNATEKEIVMSNDVRDVSESPDSGNGPLRHFRAGRRAVLQSLATGVGAVAFASAASAAHVHQAAATAAKPTDSATTSTADSALLFLDRHTFDTLALLSEQIVPGSRAVKVPEFLDRLLAVESIDTQKRFTQALGTFEREAREAHGIPWKALTAEQATTLLTKISTQPDSDASRHAFDGIKGAVAETYYSSEAGMKELGWNGSVAFAAPATCG
jgi:hypothetical protein